MTRDSFSSNRKTYLSDRVPLMTGVTGNSEFVSPRGTLRVSGKQNSLFPVGPVIKCFVIPPNSQ